MSKETPKFKRLFWDIETSPNLVFSWNVGHKISIDYNSIVKERSIITICWKWEGEKKVHSLTWKDGDDKKLVQEFAKVLNTCNESVTHNGINFDEKWFRTRCLLHGVSVIPDLQSVDTLRLARRYFKMNSNRLNYIGQFLGVGKKVDTGGFGLWKDIVLKNDRKALAKMVKYCQGDVLLLERIFNKIKSYTLAKSHKGVANGKEPHNCPECGSDRCISNGVRIMANGLKKYRLHCQSCGRYHSISATLYESVKPLIEK